MDYKYIEQLLERYWNGSSSVEEERLLRDFFHQEDIPEHLRKYRPIFQYQDEQAEISLGKDFDEKILHKINPQEVKAKRVNIAHNFRPLYKAAAIVAIILTLGNAIQHSFSNQDKAATDPEVTYQDTYSDPQVAYEQVTNVLKTVSDEMNGHKLKAIDTLKHHKDLPRIKQ